MPENWESEERGTAWICEIKLFICQSVVVAYAQFTFKAISSKKRQLYFLNIKQQQKCNKVELFFIRNLRISWNFISYLAVTTAEGILGEENLRKILLSSLGESLNFMFIIDSLKMWGWRLEIKFNYLQKKSINTHQQFLSIQSHRCSFVIKKIIIITFKSKREKAVKHKTRGKLFPSNFKLYFFPFFLVLKKSRHYGG